jgi:hypothetical protein
MRSVGRGASLTPHPGGTTGWTPEVFAVRGGMEEGREGGGGGGDEGRDPGGGGSGRDEGRDELGGGNGTGAAWRSTSARNAGAGRTSVGMSSIPARSSSRSSVRGTTVAG